MLKTKLKVLLIFFISFSYSQSMKINFYNEDKNVNLYAFVGEKISIEEFDPNARKEIKKEIDKKTGDTIIRNSYTMDRAFKLKYKVLKNLFNDLKVDTIEFVAYDHYGKPSFIEFKNVILYISKSQDGKYYHQKYQYNEIYKTKNNEWIGLLNFGSVYYNEEALKLNFKKIKLDKSIYFDIKNIPKQNINLLYPTPYFNILKDKAIPVLGLELKVLIEYKIKTITELIKK